MMSALVPNRTGIEKRPAEVDNLETDGHWEGDTIIGANQKGVIVTLVERRNDLLRAVHVASKHAGEVAKAILLALADIPNHVPHYRIVVERIAQDVERFFGASGR